MYVLIALLLSLQPTVDLLLQLRVYVSVCLCLCVGVCVHVKSVKSIDFNKWNVMINIL